jgi:hypothetical protein
MVAILGRMCTYSGKELTWEEALASDVELRPTEYAWNGTPPTVPDANGVYPVAVPGVTKVV